MALFKKSKAQKERAAFRKIVAKRTTQASRKAFAEEAVKVAGERARAKARRPTIGESLRNQAKRSIKKASKRRKATAKRTIRSPAKLKPISVSDIFG